MRHLVFVLLLGLMAWGMLPGCGGGGSVEISDDPPLVTEVILDDESPPMAGCELLARHALSECRNGTWHVVTKGTYVCDATQVVKEIHVIRTNQPCNVNATPRDPLTLFGIALERPLTCTAPVTLRGFHVIACPQGVTWNWLAYDVLQCADGTLYLERVPAADIVTQVSCTDPPPDSSAGP